MRNLLTILAIFFATSVFAAKPTHKYVRIKTGKGECVIILYNATPKHRDNFLKLAREGFYNGTLFHRVIQNFMIQGGDPDSKTAKPGQALGEGDLGYMVPAEFRPNLFHKKGVLAAARDTNAAKSSSASQFYIVQGKKFTDEQLDMIETQRLQGRKIPAEHREVYKTLGGTPHLDQNYTVYGEVITGLDMVDKIAAVKTSRADRPEEDVRMEVTVLKNREARKLEKSMGLKEKP